MPSALPYEARAHNSTGTEHCEWCVDEGLVVVATRPMTPSPPRNRVRPKHRAHLPAPRSTAVEEMGPCPYCEVGFKIEFGVGTRRNRDGSLGEDVVRGGPWGPEGFWRGREVPILERMPAHNVRPDPNAGANLRKLMASIGVAVEPA